MAIGAPMGGVESHWIPGRFFSVSDGVQPPWIICHEIAPDHVTNTLFRFPMHRECPENANIGRRL
jgi:hypothetical protein